MTDKQAPNFIERWTSVIMDNKLPSDKQAPESRGTEARKAFDELLNAGMQLANCAFNLKDRAEALTDREKSILAECQARWDRAVQTRGDIRLALLATQRSTEPAVRGDAEAERIERMNLEGMAECMTMFRDDMIRLGIIDSSVPPMFMTEAIKSAIVRADRGEFRDRIGINLRGSTALLAQTPEGKDET